VHGLLAQFERQNGIAREDLRATFAGRLTQPVDRMSPPFWRYNHAERQLLFSSYHLNSDTLPFYVGELSRRQPAEIIGYPSAIATVAAYLTQRPDVTVRPRVVITNSETLFEWQRTAIEQAFGCPVRDYYGSAEAVIFAAQCSQGQYHVNPLLGIAEVLDPSGTPASEGMLVCTTLTNTVMPLVRYEVGDAAVRGTDACACGSRWPAFKHIIGRVDDMIVTPDGRQVGRIDHIFKGLYGIRECQVIQEEEDLIRLLIVRDVDFNQQSLLLANISERLGADMRVELQFVDSVPRSPSGKFRGVISRIRTTSSTAAQSRPV
jgi:phenylacetate-CoA ligase